MTISKAKSVEGCQQNFQETFPKHFQKSSIWPGHETGLNHRYLIEGDTASATQINSWPSSNKFLKFGASIYLIVCNVVKKIGAFIVHSLSFNLADLNWPKDQFDSFRYLCTQPVLNRLYTAYKKNMLKSYDYTQTSGLCLQARTWREQRIRCIRRRDSG